MKTSFITLMIIFLIINISYTQDCSEYDNLIQEGNAAFSNSNYERAVKRYNLAMLNCPDKIAEVQERILGVFREIEKLKKDAEEQKQIAVLAKEKTEIALIEVQKQKDIAEAERAKNERIINSLYFYDDRFALAFKKVRSSYKYGFIDKQGNTTIEYKYDEALPFEYFGYAKVKCRNINYLIDTLGNEYPTINDIAQINENALAIDLRGMKLQSIPIRFFDNTRLQILLLNGNKLSYLPQEIGQLKQLQILYLKGNQLSYLPQEIGQLTQLQTLHLIFNQLSFLPTEIKQLTQLQTLSVSSNQLSALPIEIGQLRKLQHLYLDNNHLSSLPEEIGHLTKLQYLFLDNNQLSSLPEEIGHLTKLQRLSISNNQLSSLPEGIEHLAKLQYLYIKNNNFSNQEREKIKKLLPNCKIIF